MTEITLTDAQYKILPYKSTTIVRGRSLGDIIGLLETHGIKDYRWTRFEDTDILEFPIKIVRDDVTHGFAVKLTVPKLYYMKRRGRSRSAPKTRTYLENVSWRIFWWHLKSKLEAIQFGISDEVKEFMYNLNYALPGGKEVNLGQILINNVEELGNMNALPAPTRAFVESKQEELNE